MWVAERDGNGNINVTYEENDTYEELYKQLGMTTEQFADWATSKGITLSLDGSGMSFNITDFVLKNNSFDADFTGSNCHGFVGFATGNTSTEEQIAGQDLMSTLGSPSQVSTPHTGDVAVFPLNGDLTQKDGTITLSKGDPAHSAIFILKNQAGESQYLNRINTGQLVTINSGTQIINYFNNASQQYAPYVRNMPSIVPNPIYDRVR